MVSNRLEQQMAFILEIDKLKRVDRQTLIVDGTRPENSAEHSWHIALMALLMVEHIDQGSDIDLLKVVKMLLVHDIIEIDAGDVFAYDEDEEREEREKKAGRRIFGLLPKDQAEELYQLWREFEERQTPEARYAASLDRLLPLVQNYLTGGYTWVKYHIPEEKVRKRNQVIIESSRNLWEYAQTIIDQAKEKGYFEK
ncbi:MAG: HD domain-containing protein [Syntrophomonadaceae bacterium]|jgi:putative hydrolase of HD superfamily|nr:HD domain-containing protein [Syntrophomonadaceae bacterium]